MVGTFTTQFLLFYFFLCTNLQSCSSRKPVRMTDKEEQNETDNGEETHRFQFKCGELHFYLFSGSCFALMLIINFIISHPGCWAQISSLWVVRTKKHGNCLLHSELTLNYSKANKLENIQLPLAKYKGCSDIFSFVLFFFHCVQDTVNQTEVMFLVLNYFVFAVSCCHDCLSMYVFI